MDVGTRGDNREGPLIFKEERLILQNTVNIACLEFPDQFRLI